MIIRLVGKQRKKFQPWVEKTLRPRFPELEAPLMAAVDAFDAAQESGRLLPEQLAAIVAALSSPRRPLYENVCGLMGTLSANHPEAEAAILAMSRSPKSHVRFNALICLNKSTPAGTMEQVLKAGLLDKSARVRIKATDWICGLRKAEFVHELAAALLAERQSDVRRTMSFVLRLLRDGYILEEVEQDCKSVTVLTEEGGVRNRIFTEETLRTQGIDAVVIELRRPFP
jgi:hypothetical protein